jgi:hypothetical protein
MMTELETRLIGLFTHYVEESTIRDKQLVALLSDFSGRLERLEALYQRLREEH